MCIYYHGGKKRAAAWIVEKFPPAMFFLDICGGGGSVSAAAAASGKFGAVVYNDVDTLLHDFLTTVALRPRALESFIRAWPLGRHSLENIGELINSENRLHRAAGVFLSINLSARNVPQESVTDFVRCRYNARGVRNMVRERNTPLREIASAAKRLRDVNFEKLDGMILYERYFGHFSPEKAPTAAIFLDPPYGKTKNYKQTDFGLDECLKIFADKAAFVGVCYTPSEDLAAVAEETIPFHSHLRGWNQSETFSHNLYLNFKLDFGPLFSGT